MKEVRKMPSLLRQGVKPAKHATREPLYSAGDIASLTGLTKRQVNYRLKKLKIEPEGKTQPMGEVCLKGRLLYKKEVVELVRSYI